MSGTDLTDFYVNGSVGGTANIHWKTVPATDLISVGLAGALTNANITVDNSTLNGAQTGLHL